MTNFTKRACVNCVGCNRSPWSVECLKCVQATQGYSPATLPNFVQASDEECTKNWTSQGYTNPLGIFEENEEGCTLNLNTLEKVVKTSGYYVAITDNELKFITLSFIEELRVQAKGDPNIYLGYWKDSKTNKHYLDLSVWVEDKEEALKLAVACNQKAVWDIAGVDSLYVEVDA